MRHFLRLARRAVLTVCLGLIACTGDKAAPPATLGPSRLNVIVRPLRHVARPLTTTETAALSKVPAGVDAQIWQQIRDEFIRSISAPGRTASQPPSGSYNNLKDLQGTTIGGTQPALQWTYINVGDYDVNSQVNISDLTPIGINFLRTSADANWDQARLADGDENGEVNIADVTQLGANFGAEVTGYTVYGGDSDQGPWIDLGNIRFTEASGEPLPVFLHPVPQWYDWWLIVPFDETPDSPPVGAGGAVYQPGAVTPVSTAVIGSSGGTVSAPGGSELDGVSVTLPPNALLSSVNIKLGADQGSVQPALGTVPGPILSLESEQEQFYQPASITMPYPGDGYWPMPYYIDTEGDFSACDLVAVDPTAGTCTFQSWHASPYVVIVEPVSSLTAPPSDSLNYQTGFVMSQDAFQIDNEGSVYNDEGECLGMIAFSQWYLRKKKHTDGAFYPRFMQPVGSRIGQQVIATRAGTSNALVWLQYLPGIMSTQHGLTTDALIFRQIRNNLVNTGEPVCLHLYSGGGNHAVLVYAIQGQTLTVYDPNNHNAPASITLSGDPAGFDTFYSGGAYSDFFMIGDGSLYLAEPFERIYADAVSGFNGSNDAQLAVTSPTNGSSTSETSVLLKGTYTSGEVLVAEIDLLINGKTFVRASLSGNEWAALIPLDNGDNYIEFITRGQVAKAGLIPIPHTHTERFKLVRGAGAPGTGALEIRLTRTPADSSLDLYVTDSTGVYNWYYLAPNGCDAALTQADIWSPQVWSLPAGTHPNCPGPYTVRVHNNGSTPGNYSLKVTYNPGLPSETSSTSSGHIETGDFFNHDPGATGPDWADVGTYSPKDP